MLRNIVAFSNPGASSSDPVTLAEVGGVVLVKLGQHQEGVSRALASTGIPGGAWTWLSSVAVDSSSSPSAITADSAGGLRFAAVRPDVGNEPWVLDSAGVRLMEDVVAGPGSLRPTQFLVHAGRTTMIPSTEDAAEEPYVWDGTVVQQINLFGAGDSEPGGLYPVGNLVLTIAEGPMGNRSLWAIDPVTGAAEELTTEVPQRVVPAGNTVFFSISDDLWKTDGTASGTVLVMPGLGSVSRGTTLVEGDGGTLPLVIFQVNTSPISLWKTDGTTAGTEVVHMGFIATLGEQMMVSGGRALLVGRLTSNNFQELYLTNGTAAGTFQLTNRNNDGAFTPSGLRLLGATSGGWFYHDTRSDTGRELWFTDGVTETLIELLQEQHTLLH